LACAGTNPSAFYVSSICSKPLKSLIALAL
jgi:hypothetical protein